MATTAIITIITTTITAVISAQLVAGAGGAVGEYTIVYVDMSWAPWEFVVVTMIVLFPFTSPETVAVQLAVRLFTKVIVALIGVPLFTVIWTLEIPPRLNALPVNVIVLFFTTELFWIVPVKEWVIG